MVMVNWRGKERKIKKEIQLHKKAACLFHELPSYAVSCFGECVSVVYTQSSPQVCLIRGEIRVSQASSSCLLACVPLFSRHLICG